MYELTRPDRRERAILVGVYLSGNTIVPVEESLDELALLADTAGADVVDRHVQNRDRPDPGTFVGSGFAERISGQAEALEADLVIFDEDLSAAQVKNLERVIPTKIVDRSGLILDIFAERARTREARTQVELAQLEYLLPRLTRAWTHLSRQVGGIGTRGPGETQLEVDRRLVRRRIGSLHKELDRIEHQRNTRRSGRSGHFQATLVGYTNAGKSTLLNRLTASNVFVENRLFATLDATTRSLGLPGGPGVLLTDTVGFIRKLPPGLVASFRSTLEEAVVADLLLHMVDLSHPWYEDHISSANTVLDDLGILDHPTVMVFNKADRVDEAAATRARAAHPGAVVISAETGTGMKELQNALLEEVRRQQVVAAVRIPQERPDLLNSAHESGTVLERTYDERTVHLVLRTSRACAGRLAALLKGVEGASIAERGAPRADRAVHRDQDGRPEAEETTDG